MPPLYDFDDYDRCLYEAATASPATYCFVRADIEPDSRAAAWRAIEEISKYDRHHFDHRHLYFGLCVHKCESELEALDADAVHRLQAGILTDNMKVSQAGGGELTPSQI